MTVTPTKNSSVPDFSKPQTALQVFERSPLLTSHAAGWTSIHLEYHHQSPYKKPETYPLQHVIFIKIAPSTGGRIIDGRLSCQQATAGDIVIVPANTPHQCWSDTDSKFILLSLEPTLFRRVAGELIDPERVELMPLFPQPEPLIYQIALSLKTELETDGAGSRLYAETMANALAVHLLKHYATQKAGVRDDSGGMPRAKLQQVTDYINEYLNQDLSLNELAAIVQMSPTYFGTLFKQATGLAPHQYVVHQRVNRAKTMLLNSNLAIAEIATETGFSDQSHLIRHMHRLLGVRPKQLRQQNLMAPKN